MIVPRYVGAAPPTEASGATCRTTVPKPVPLILA